MLTVAVGPLSASDQQESAIRNGVDVEFTAGPFGSKWTEARFRIPFGGNVTEKGIGKRAAEVMKLLIDRTYPLVQSILNGNGE
jgi:hypothetical protein